MMTEPGPEGPRDVVLNARNNAWYPQIERALGACSNLRVGFSCNPSARDAHTGDTASNVLHIKHHSTVVSARGSRDLWHSPWKIYASSQPSAGINLLFHFQRSRTLSFPTNPTKVVQAMPRSRLGCRLIGARFRYPGDDQDKYL